MKKRLITLVFFLTIIIFTVILQVSKENKSDTKSKEIYNQVITEMLYTREQRIQGIKKLKQILEEDKYLDSELELKIISELGRIYALNGEYLESVESLIKGIDLASKLKDNYIVCKNLINLSTEFINLKGYDTAIKTLNYALELEIEDENQNNKIKEYTYMNLADIYMRMNECDKAKVCLKKAKVYTNKIPNVDNQALNATTIIEANILFKENRVNEALTLLEKLETNKENFIVIDELIPYLQLKAKIAFYYGNNEEGSKISYTLFELCESEQQLDIELYLMEDIVYNLEKNNNESQVEIINNYRKTLLSLYEKSTLDKNRESVMYIIENINSKLLEIENLNNKIRLQMILIVFILVFFILVLKITKVKNQNNRDGLTNIYNRKYYDILYNRYINSNMEIGLILLDIDYFKSINDNYGHIFGDEVIKVIAKTIKNKLSPNEKIFRYGGEEFCVLCKKESYDKVVKLAEDIRYDIENLKWENNIKVTISIGIGFKPKNNKDNIFSKADKNLYESKINGRNRVTY